MARPLHDELTRGRALLVVASRGEATAILERFGSIGRELTLWRRESLTPKLDIVLTGVGKANAAGAVARTLEPARHTAVMNLGIAGSLPGSGLHLGDVVFASSSVFADEGVATPAGYQNLAAMGFPISPDGMCVSPAASLQVRLQPLADRTGPIATVSTCSGTDELAEEIVRRTGAIAEAMEGAAAGLATAHIAQLNQAPLTFIEIRVLSNTTGRRDQQRWDRDGAFSRLGDLAADLEIVFPDV